jgi:uncharacterized Rmd1/YagE family protein
MFRNIDRFLKKEIEELSRFEETNSFFNDYVGTVNNKHSTIVFNSEFITAHNIHRNVFEIIVGNVGCVVMWESEESICKEFLETHDVFLKRLSEMIPRKIECVSVSSK